MATPLKAWVTPKGTAPAARTKGQHRMHFFFPAILAGCTQQNYAPCCPPFSPALAATSGRMRAQPLALALPLSSHPAARSFEHLLLLLLSYRPRYLRFAFLLLPLNCCAPSLPFPPANPPSPHLSRGRPDPPPQTLPEHTLRRGQCFLQLRSSVPSPSSHSPPAAFVAEPKACIRPLRFSIILSPFLAVSTIAPALCSPPTIPLLISCPSFPDPHRARALLRFSGFLRLPQSY